MSRPSGEAAAIVRPAVEADAPAVADIYNHFVAGSIATFEEEPVAAAEIARRMRGVRERSFPWLVAERDGGLRGYAYATAWKGRSAYRHSVEITVYVAPGSAGQGLGTRLYEALFAALRDRGVHAVLGGIALPNDASVALHEKLGLVKVAHLPEVGFKFGRWIDVGYWHRVL